MNFKAPYWMHPLVIMTAWAIVCVLAALIDRHVYVQLMRTGKFIGLKHVLIYGLALLNFCIFCYMAMHRKALPSMGRDPWSALECAVNSPAVARIVLAAVAVVTIAYLIWFFPTFDARVFARLIRGTSVSVMRGFGNQISGVTTLTQLGIPLAAVSVFGILLGRTRKRRNFYRVCLSVIAAFAAYRMIVWSERLALFEVLIPAVAALTLVRYRGQWTFRWLPVVAFFGAVFIFGVSEYFRSWNFYGNRSSGIVSFSFFRFFSYYLSSMNNMAMLIDRVDPTYLPLNTLQFLFKMPLPGFDSLNRIQGALWQETFKGSLAAYANPEFNLFGAVGLAINDFGVAGGIMTMAVFGWLTGRLFSDALEGHFLGLVFYPCWMVGLLEFGRLLYWSNGRAFPAWIMAFVLVYAMHRSWIGRAMPMRSARPFPHFDPRGELRGPALAGRSEPVR